MEKKIKKIKDRFFIATRGENSEKELSKILKKRKIKFSNDFSRNLKGVCEVNCKHAKDGGTLFELLEKETLKNNKNKFVFALILEQDEDKIQGLTNEIIIAFKPEITGKEITEFTDRFNLFKERLIGVKDNTYLFSTRTFPNYDLIELVREINASKKVVYAESNYLYSADLDAYTPNDPLMGQLPHLPLIEADDAWEFFGDYASNYRGGNPDVCIAVFDPHGVTPNHPDLTANLSDGTSKLLLSFDFANMQAQTVGNLGGNHGTQCAGSATAAFDNNRGTAGVAPNCRLIGASLPNPATGVEMADAWLWSVGIDNGSTDPNFPALPSQPADVISNSWGHYGVALPLVFQNAFDRITDDGRGGKGALICFSVGNSGYINFTNNPGLRRMYAAYNRTIAVGASINTNPTNPVANSSNADPTGDTTNIATQVDTRALYSPFGPSLDVVAPSHTAYGPGGIIDPILSTTRVGVGNVDGCPGPGVCNDYAVSFGGTSHACPTVAGVLALILSANPFLSWEEARSILRKTSDRIDFGQTNAIGQWVDNDGDGINEYSQWYGYGRVNAFEAVKEAIYLKMAYTNQII